MKAFVWILAASITANAVLAGYWLSHRDSAASVSVAGESQDSAASSSVGTKKSKRQGDAVQEQADAATGATEIALASIVSWKDIQSAELKEWIRRLRAVGCPEETVRDVIVAEVNRRYAVKMRSTWEEDYANRPFWKVQKRQFDAEQSKKQRERMVQQRELQKEKSALLVELLGVDPEKLARTEEGYPEDMAVWDWQERRVSFLPAEKRQVVLKYLEEWDDKMSDFHQKNQGLYDAQYRAEQKQMEADRLAGLSQFLTPAELREYELRNSNTGNTLSHNLREMDVTREQYEALYDIHKKYGDSIYNWGDDNNNPDKTKQIEQNKKNMSADIASALGTDMAKQFERGQDYYYQQLSRTAKRYELPADTANKVFDYKQSAEDGAKKIREDKNLSNEERQQLLSNIRNETETTIKQTLGDKAWKSYSRNGAWWLNSIAPTPPKPKPTVTTQ